VKVQNLKKQRGMAATEYIIGLILVAVGSIGIFSLFGKQIGLKVAQVTAALGGNAENVNKASAEDASEQALTQGKTSRGMEIKQDDLAGANK
jgi:Flp pilus assembly pilin Flp